MPTGTYPRNSGTVYRQTIAKRNESIIQIRQSSPDISLKELAEMFGLTETRIRQISGRRYQPVNNPLGSRDPIYRVWRGMLHRCYNPKQESYPEWGGRGIKVCNRWLGENGFINFYGDMGIRPDGVNAQGFKIPYEIERVDNNGNYEPSNCIWATAHTQRHNQRIL
jgi:hypothetical protein